MTRVGHGLIGNMDNIRRWDTSDGDPRITTLGVLVKADARYATVGAPHRCRQVCIGESSARRDVQVVGRGSLHVTIRARIEEHLLAARETFGRWPGGQHVGLVWRLDDSVRFLYGLQVIAAPALDGDDDEIVALVKGCRFRTQTGLGAPVADDLPTGSCARGTR